MIPLTILSLGAGVQSSALLLMSCQGILPRLDCAIFADTGWEPQAVYEHLAWLEEQAARHGIPVYRVTAGNLRSDALRSKVRDYSTDDGERWFCLPLYTLADGADQQGRLRRQCTKEYKIEPIERKTRDLLGLKPRQPWPKEHMVDQWYGISLDEASRMRTPSVAWKQHVYPLCGVPTSLLPKSYRRGDCLAWLAEQYPSRVVPRSACIGCPFHSNAEWRRLRDESPEEWADAVAFDRAIRKMGGIRGDVFLHRKCVPLDAVDLRTAEDHGQLNWLNECLGLCGS